MKLFKEKLNWRGLIIFFIPIIFCISQFTNNFISNPFDKTAWCADNAEGLKPYFEKTEFWNLINNNVQKYFKKKNPQMLFDNEKYKISYGACAIYELLAQGPQLQNTNETLALSNNLLINCFSSILEDISVDLTSQNYLIVDHINKNIYIADKDKTKAELDQMKATNDRSIEAVFKDYLPDVLIKTIKELIFVITGENDNIIGFPNAIKYNFLNEELITKGKNDFDVKLSESSQKKTIYEINQKGELNSRGVQNTLDTSDNQTIQNFLIELENVSKNEDIQAKMHNFLALAFADLIKEENKKFLYSLISLAINAKITTFQNVNTLYQDNATDKGVLDPQVTNIPDRHNINDYLNIFADAIAKANCDNEEKYINKSDELIRMRNKIIDENKTNAPSSNIIVPVPTSKTTPTQSNSKFMKIGFFVSAAGNCVLLVTIWYMIKDPGESKKTEK